MHETKLAIIIPYFKKSFFEETLLSLKNQSNRRFKLYVGDDCSPDNPKTIINKYKNYLDITYVRYKKNLGEQDLVNQWERCIDLTKKEDWFVILGDDDVLAPSFVNLFYANYHIFSERTNVVRYASTKLDAKGCPISEIYTYPKWEKSSRILFNGKRSSLSEYVFKKVTYEEIKFKNFPLAWFTDILAVLEFSNFSMIYTINDAVVGIRCSNENISSKNDKQSMTLKLRASFNFYDYLLRNRRKQFSSSELAILLQRISKTYVNDKKELKRFYKISFYYIYFSLYREYFRFLGTICICFLNRK